MQCDFYSCHINAPDNLQQFVKKNRLTKILAAPRLINKIKCNFQQLSELISDPKVLKTVYGYNYSLTK